MNTGKFAIVFAMAFLMVISPIHMRRNRGGSRSSKNYQRRYQKPAYGKGKADHSHSHSKSNSNSYEILKTYKPRKASKLQCPADILTETDRGQNSSVVEFATPSSSSWKGYWDHDDKVVCTPESGSEFPIGTTSVTCQGNGKKWKNDQMCSFTVTVIDTESPMIMCPENIVLNVTKNLDFPRGTEGLEVEIPEAEAMDNAGEVMVECTHSGSTFLPPGVTPVVCRARDEAGNQADCCFEVIINPVRSILDTLCTPSSGNIGFQCLVGCVDLNNVALCNGRDATVTCGNDEDPVVCDFANDLPCGDNLLACQNGGSCILDDCIRLTDTDDCINENLVAMCICPPGFTGPTCELPEGSCQEFND